MTGTASFVCPVCGRVLRDPNDRFQHVKAKHGAKVAKPLKPPRDDEPSLGQELAEAIMTTHAGKPVPRHIWLMFREQLPPGARPEPDQQDEVM